MSAALEVLLAFLKLGLASFGGPIAHIGYFHREFVQRRRWLSDAHYAQLVAVSQFLPGPASSQVGFSLGLMRAGWLGALAAFIGFTLPSAFLMYVFAHVLPRLDSVLGAAILHGFKLVAVAVVAQGLAAMAPRLAPDPVRWMIALGAGAATLVDDTALVQLAVVVVSGALGSVLCRTQSIASTVIEVRYDVRTGVVLLALFAVLLGFAFLPDSGLPELAAVAKAFYRSGALVFGGAHVVLPLLEEAVVDPGWIDRGEFLAGYGAAQAVPGPMFSVSAFLGARLETASHSAIASSVSTLAIFLPGLVLMAAVLPLWGKLVANERAMSAVAGINAAVVGLLAAALYDPVWTGAVIAPLDAAIALIGFALLIVARTSVWVVLLWCVGAAVVNRM